MGDERGRSTLGSVLLALLMATSLLSTVQAQSGSVLIDEESVSLQNASTFEGSTLFFSLEIHETGGQQANVSARLVVQSLEGSELNNSSVSVAPLSIFEQRNISFSIDDLPFGFSQVTVILEGDVGTNSTGYVTSVSRTVQRLRPLNISFGGPASVTVEGLDGSGITTGNMTLHDGDFVRFAFPVLNQGDVHWSGNITLALQNGENNESVSLSGVSVNASNALTLTVEPSIRLTEGALLWSLHLDGNLSTASGIHSLSGEFSVLPPPLPLIAIEIGSNAAEVNAGEQLDVQLTVWNNGSAAFSGYIVCQADGVERLNATTPLSVLGSANLTFSMSAKPTTVACTAGGSRLDASSLLPSSLNIDMASAVFEAAGTPSPTYSGGPWHKGDTLHANMLLRNTGDLDGRVRLVLESGGTISSGEWTELKGGSAGEVATTLQLFTEGDVDVSWTLESDNGLVEGVISGSTSFTVLAQQSVALGIQEVTRNEVGHVTFTVSLDLDEGRGRDIQLQIGYDTGDSTIFLREQLLSLQAGVYEEEVDLGELDGERVVVQIAAENWVIGPGPLSITSSIPNEATVFWMDFGATTSPLRPLQDDSVSVSLVFQQSGPVSTSVGEVWVMDAYGAILGKATSPDWGGERSAQMEVDVTWPKGSTVALRALWHVDGLVVSEETSYVSGEVVVDNSFEWPLGAIAWGMVLGAALILGVRLKNRTTSEPSSPQPTKKTPTPPSSKADTAAEKREISCPECDRRLRVPVTYTGSVGCPDCATKFHVEAEQQETDGQKEEVVDDLDPEPMVSKAPVAQDGKLEIACPDCAQSLRIPASYNGSVRCPACTKIFKANEGVTILE